MFLTSPFTNFINSVSIDSGGDKIIEAERTVIGYILNWIRILGTGIALIVLTYMSIKYMTAKGPEEKSALKKTLSTYLVGAIVLIGATNIICIVEQFVEAILGDMFIT